MLCHEIQCISCEIGSSSIISIKEFNLGKFTYQKSYEYGEYGSKSLSEVFSEKSQASSTSRLVEILKRSLSSIKYNQ